MAVPTKHAEAVGRVPIPAVGEPIRPWTGAFHPSSARQAGAVLPPPPPPTATTYADSAYPNVYTIPLPDSACAPSSPVSSSEDPASSFTSSSSGSVSGAHNDHGPAPETGVSSALPSPLSAPSVPAGVVVVKVDKVPTSPTTPPSPPPPSPTTGAFVQLNDVYKCPHEGCTKAFARRYNLATHLRRHTGETPYGCPVVTCGKRFKWRSSMAHHLRSHRRAGLVIEACPIRKSKSAPVYGHNGTAPPRGLVSMPSPKPASATSLPAGRSSAATMGAGLAASAAGGKGRFSACRPAPLVVPTAKVEPRQVAARHLPVDSKGCASGADAAPEPPRASSAVATGRSSTKATTAGRSHPVAAPYESPDRKVVALPHQLPPLPAVSQLTMETLAPAPSPSSVVQYGIAGMSMPVAAAAVLPMVVAGGTVAGGPAGTPSTSIPPYLAHSLGDVVPPSTACDLGGFLPLGGGRALDSPVSSAGSEFVPYERVGESDTVGSSPSFEAAMPPSGVGATYCAPVHEELYSADLGMLFNGGWNF